MSPRNVNAKTKDGQLDRVQHILRGIVLFLGALVFLFPFYYMIIGSLQKSPDPTIAGAFPNPANLTLDNYAAINSRVDLLQGLINSGILTGGVIIGTVVFGVLVGYALAQLQWRGRGVTFALALLVQVVPFQLLMIPLYVLIARDYGLADNYLGMILPFAINSTAVIIFRQYFLQVPRELFDAARIDGAGELVLLWRIALPLATPVIALVGFFNFVGNWNNYFLPFIMEPGSRKMPVQVGLAELISNVPVFNPTTVASITISLPQLAFATLISVAPVLIIFLFSQRFLVTGLTAGATKE